MALNNDFNELDQLDREYENSLGAQLPIPKNNFASLDQLDQEFDQSKPELSAGDRALQFAHGMAKTYGTLADLASKYIAAPVSEHIREPLLQKTPEWVKKVTPQDIAAAKAKTEQLHHPTFTQTMTEPLEKIAGRELTPTEEDKLGQFVHTAGEFMVPLPGGGLIKAGQKGATTLAKHLGREAAVASGASAALTQTPQFTEEGTLGRVAEDLAKVMIGVKAGHFASDKAKGLASWVQTQAKSPKYNATQALTGAPARFAAKISSIGAKPNKEVLEKAAKHGVDLPFNVGMNSKLYNFMANNYLKSMFSSDVYKKVWHEADHKMIDEVKKSIDTLGPSTYKPHEVSAQYRQHAKEHQAELEGVKRELYEDSRSLLSANDKVIPRHTADALLSLKENLVADVLSPASKPIVATVNQLAKSWGLLPEKMAMAGEEITDPKLIASIVDSFKKAGSSPIDLKRLTAVRSELGDMLEHDPTIVGKKSLLRRLYKAVDKDIDSTDNKAFLEKWRANNAFFKNEIADRFRTDFAQSLIRGEAPKEAFNEMNTPEHIRILENIAGDSAKGKEVMDALKKAKVRQMFENAVQGDLETGTLRHAAFAKIFDKREKNQEVLEALLGKEQYNKLSDIAEISNAFSTSGRELLNTSGTAIAASDIGKIERLVKDNLGFIFSAGAGASIGDVTGAITGAVAPNLLSRLVANKNFVMHARTYALERSRGNDKHAQTILNRLINMTEKEIRYLGLQNVEEPKKEKEKESE